MTGEFWLEVLGTVLQWGLVLLAFAILAVIVRSLEQMKREIREATHWAGVARRDAEAAARFSEEAMAARFEALGPWKALALAIEAEPEGRLQLDRTLFEGAKNLPSDDEVNGYLWDRWPGLRVWREDLGVDYLGIVVAWSERP